MNEGGSFPRKCLETGVRMNGHSHKEGRNTPRGDTGRRRAGGESFLVSAS